MLRLQAANNAGSTLAAGMTDVATSLQVADASSFPSAPFMITIEDEILEVTEVAGTIFTVLRAQESTTAAAHNSGARVENLWTAGMYAELETSAGAQAKVDAHTGDYEAPHKYEDEGTDPEYDGVKYRLVVINGEPFLEVVEVPT